MQYGLVYIFTGDGKGKTSAALGVAIRAVGNGMKVAMVQWYKEASWRISEYELEKLTDKFHIYPMGVGFHMPQKVARLATDQVVVDKASETDHHQAAQAAYDKSVELCPQVDLLICDEILNAVHDGLMTESEVFQLIENRQATHLILTGRNASPSVIAAADLVTEMKKIKHPYDQGKVAVKGLDF